MTRLVWQYLVKRPVDYICTMMAVTPSVKNTVSEKRRDNKNGQLFWLIMIGFFRTLFKGNNFAFRRVRDILRF